LNEGSRGSAFIAWYRPVFWPYAYDDLFEYLLWPSDDGDYDGRFWVGAFAASLDPAFAPAAAAPTGRPPMPARTLGQSAAAARACAAWRDNPESSLRFAAAERRVALLGLPSRCRGPSTQRQTRRSCSARLKQRRRPPRQPWMLLAPTRCPRPRSVGSRRSSAASTPCGRRWRSFARRSMTSTARSTPLKGHASMAPHLIRSPQERTPTPGRARCRSVRHQPRRRRRRPTSNRRNLPHSWLSPRPSGSRSSACDRLARPHAVDAATAARHPGDTAWRDAGGGQDRAAGPCRLR